MTRLRVVAPLVGLVVAAGAPMAVAGSCPVTPYDAYTYAVQRGWSFSCKSAGVGNGSVQPVVGAEVRCTFKTPPIVPPGAVLAAAFFKKGTQGRHNGDLNNGWKVAAFTASPQHKQGSPGSNQHALYASIPMTVGGKVYTIKIKTLTLSKSGASCNSWKDAFK